MAVDAVEVVAFALCWLAASAIMLWAVFTEAHRDGWDLRFRRPLANPHVAEVEGPPARWVLVETVDGRTDAALAEARLVLAAWLAAWGLDEEDLAPDDVRSEAFRTGDGAELTRILVRASALPRRHRHRQLGA